MVRTAAQLFSRALFVAATLSLLSIGGCRPAREKKPPDVILITIGALRPDHLSSVGYGRPTTPFLDRLAGRGWIFADCSSVSSQTVPALASLFTGLYPRSHGVRRGPAEGEAVNGPDRLADRFLTLAEILRSAGYATLGVCADGPAVTETGLAQGFDELAVLRTLDAESVYRAALALQGKIAASRPVFFWIHCCDPCAPYRPHEPWISRYSPNPGQAGEWGKKTMRVLRREEGEILRRPELVSTLVDLYDSEIGFTDAFLERLFREVVPEADSLVIVVSDHGEAFGEHGALGHGASLFQEEIAVPLIVLLPGREGRGRTVTTPVSLVDVFPTILDGLGLSASPGLPGRSLLPSLEEGADQEPRPIFFELNRGGELAGLRLQEWKLIARPKKTESKWALYDLAADPGESRNLAGKNPTVFRDLSDRLRFWLSSTPEFRSAPAERNRLDGRAEDQEEPAPPR
jgi:arylsulfatase A-like enzyme